MRFAVHESLCEALHRYRRLGSGYETRDEPRWNGKAEYIWADGVCIDQSSLKEKGEQVALMQDIYQRARRVFVDFGDTMDDWIGGWAVLHHVRCTIHDVGVIETSDSHRVLQEQRAWQRLGELLDAPWFLRTWVIQEMAVPEQAPTAMFGPYSFDLGALLGLFSSFPQWPSRLASMGAVSSDGRREVFYTIRAMEDARASFHYGAISPVRLIRNIIKTNTTDPRDRLFGIMSLMKPEHRIQANYTLPKEAVFTLFAEHMVRSGFGSDFLDMAGLQQRGAIGDGGTASQRAASLRSWVVDWAMREEGNPKPFTNFPGQNTYGAGEGFAKVGMSLDEPLPSGMFDPGPGLVLKTTGLIYDTVKATSHIYGDTDNWYKDLSRAVNLYFEFVSGHKGALIPQYLHDADSCKAQTDNHDQFPVKSVLEDVFARTLVADLLHGLKPPFPYTFTMTPAELLQELRHSLKNGPPRTREGATTIEESREEVWTLIMTTPTDPGTSSGHGTAVISELSAFLTLMTRCLEHRRLVVTGRGFLGMASKITRVGDVICIIPGTKTPYALRPVAVPGEDLDERNGEYYELVGDAYIDGLMHGEALKSPDLELCTIRLI